VNGKIAAVCVTYNRPKQLGQMIRCFERQDYQNRELIILDDAGQYERTSGDRWTLISTKTRYPTLGDKRNAATRLVSPDVEYIAVWDDDDLYLPHALRATMAALRVAPLSRPSVVLHPDKRGVLSQHETGGLFHSGWGYRRETFWKYNGYQAWNNGEDRLLLKKLEDRGVATADPIALGFEPFLVYPWEVSEVIHFSNPSMSYEKAATFCSRPTRIEKWIADPKIDLDHPRILPGINPRKF